MPVRPRTRRVAWSLLSVALALAAGVYFGCGKTTLRPDLADPLRNESAAASALPPGVFRTADFVPTADGLEWVYQSGGPTSGKPDYVSTQAQRGPALAVRNNDGDEIVVRLTGDGLFMDTQKMAVQKMAFTYDPPLQVYPALLTLGQEHRFSGPILVQHPYPGSPSKGTVTWTVLPEGVQDVTVPAGTFRDCLRLKITLAIPMDNYVSVSFEQYLWLARGVGMVREQRVFNVGLGSLTLVSQESLLELKRSTVLPGTATAPATP